VNGTSQVYLITGASGAGKTTLVNALSARGHAVIEESGRQIVEQQNAVNGDALPWKDGLAFGQRLVDHTLASLARRTDQRTPIFSDRGLVDNLAWFISLGKAPPPKLLNALAQRPYADPVFLLHPWENIYVRDAVRNKGFEQAVEEFNAITAQLDRLGWPVVEVPQYSVEDRISFIERHIPAAAL